MPSDLCKRFCGLCAFLWLFTVSAEAQTVTMKGTVSEVVALSIRPNSIHGVHVNIVSSGGNVRMTLSGSGSPVIRVPLMVRSNIGFRISAIAESKTAELTQLSIVNVRATGRLVSPEAINNLETPKHLDLEGFEGPFVVASGPRVSLGGTLNSPNNALQITLLIRVKPESVKDWLVDLTFFNH